MPFVGGPHTRITNPRWRTAAILKKSKKCYISAAVRAILTKLAQWRSSTLLTVPTVKNLKFRKSKMAATAILKNLKIAISQPRFERFRRNLARWCSSTLLTVVTVKNLKFRKSKISPLWFERFQQNLAQWCRAINQSINQRQICRVPLYDMSRSANSSKW